MLGILSIILRYVTYLFIILKNHIFSLQYSRNIKPLNREVDVDSISVDDYDRKISNKGPLYEFIKFYTVGNNERVAKLSLHEYYILSMAEDLLLKSSPDSEFTYSYPDDIQKSSSASIRYQGFSTQEAIQFRLSNSTMETLRRTERMEDTKMAGTWSGVPASNQQNQKGQDLWMTQGIPFAMNIGKFDIT